MKGEGGEGRAREGRGGEGRGGEERGGEGRGGEGRGGEGRGGEGRGGEGRGGEGRGGEGRGGEKCTNLPWGTMKMANIPLLANWAGRSTTCSVYLGLQGSLADHKSKYTGDSMGCLKWLEDNMM